MTAILTMVGSILVALIVGGLASRSQRKLAVLAAEQRMEEKEADWKRQDDVAAKAAKVAQDLLDKQEAAIKQQDLVAVQAAEAAKLLIAANERVAQTANTTNQKLDVIHGLVNSSMTEAMKSELNALKRELLLLRTVIEMKKDSPLHSDTTHTEDQAAIVTSETKISELEARLSDRAKTQETIDRNVRESSEEEIAAAQMKAAEAQKEAAEMQTEAAEMQKDAAEHTVAAIESMPEQQQDVAQ